MTIMYCIYIDVWSYNIPVAIQSIYQYNIEYAYNSNHGCISTFLLVHWNCICAFVRYQVRLYTMRPLHLVTGSNAIIDSPHHGLNIVLV